MPRGQGYGERRSGSQGMASMYELGRMIRDQITGEEDRRRKMDQEFEGFQLEEAQLRLQELKGKKKRQELQDQLLALEMNRQGDIARIGAMEGAPATLRSTLGGQRQAQLQGAGGAPDIPMDLPIPDVEFQRHPMQQVRGIQMPEAGIDVAAYASRPQSLQEVLLAAAQEEENKRVDIPDLPGLPKGLGSVEKEIIPFLSNWYRQKEMGERAAAELEQETREREAGQVFETGKIGRGQVFKAGQAKKTRVSQAEQKRLDRESAERIAGIRKAARKGPRTEEEKALEEHNMFLELAGQPPVTTLPGKPEKARIEGAPEVHIEAPNGRNFTAVMAQRYKEKAGGDLQLAIDMAIEDGWKLPAGFRTGK